MCVFLSTYAHETAGAARTRSSLHPLFEGRLRPLFWGPMNLQTSGECCRENADACSGCSPHDRSDMRVLPRSRISRSLLSGAHSRDPVADDDGGDAVRGHNSAFSRHPSPEVCKFVPPQKGRSAIPRGTQGRPGARCTRGLVCKWKQQNAHEHTGSAETLRPSLRNGFTAYFVLSPARPELVCHRRSQEA